MRDWLILFSVKRELRKLFFVTRDLRFCVTREEPVLLTDICNFTTLFYVILRRGSSEWLESSIKSDLDMRFAIWSLDLAFHDFSFLKRSF